MVDAPYTDYDAKKEDKEVRLGKKNKTGVANAINNMI